MDPSSIVTEAEWRSLVDRSTAGQFRHQLFAQRIPVLTENRTQIDRILKHLEGTKIIPTLTVPHALAVVMAYAEKRTHEYYEYSRSLTYKGTTFFEGPSKQCYLDECEQSEEGTIERRIINFINNEGNKPEYDLLRDAMFRLLQTSYTATKDISLVVNEKAIQRVHRLLPFSEKRSEAAVAASVGEVVTAMAGCGADDDVLSRSIARLEMK